MMMKIYDREGYANPTRVRIAVAAKGLEPQVTWIPIDLISAEHKQPPFLEKNPSGVVPVLELEDGTCISESTAITTYLDTLDGDPILTGRTPRERAVILMMQRRAEAQVLDPLLIWFHYGTPGWGSELPKHKWLTWPGRTEWGALEAGKAREGLRHFDRLLRADPYVVGQSFSMADITLFSGVSVAKAFGHMPEDLTALAGWFERVSDLPAVRSRSGRDIPAEDLARAASTAPGAR